MGEGKEEKENRGEMRRKGCVCAFLRERYVFSSIFFFILGLDPRFYIYKSSECYIYESSECLAIALLPQSHGTKIQFK